MANNKVCNKSSGNGSRWYSSNFDSTQAEIGWQVLQVAARENYETLTPVNDDYRSLYPIKNIDDVDTGRTLPVNLDISQIDDIATTKPKQVIIRPSATDEILTEIYRYHQVYNNPNNDNLPNMAGTAVDLELKMAGKSNAGLVEGDTQRLIVGSEVGRAFTDDSRFDFHRFHPPLDNSHYNLPTSINSSPGVHNMMVGLTRVRYFIPSNVNSQTEILFAIHGLGTSETQTPYHYLEEYLPEFDPFAPPAFVDSHFTEWGEKDNLIVICPLFDRHYHKLRWYPSDSEIPHDPSIRDSPGWLIKKELLKLPLNYWRLHEIMTEDAECTEEDYPEWYHWPEDYMTDFVNLISHGLFRTDLRLFQIFQKFQNKFPHIQNDSFNIFGFSAGGQYVTRFMMLYPEYLKTIMIDAPGTYTFPCFNPDRSDPYDGRYKWGYCLDMGSTVKNEFMRTVDISKSKLMRNLALLMTKRILLLVGLDDNDEDANNFNQYVEWQGRSRLERARNWRNTMYTVSYELASIGLLSSPGFNLVHKEFIGVGHQWKPVVDWLIYHWKVNHDTYSSRRLQSKCSLLDDLQGFISTE